MKWLKHDTNAHGDAKMKKVKHKYGIVGYGLYWYCVELIAGLVCKENITFELEEDAETIALEWGLDQLKVQEIMLYFVEIELFENNESGIITCLKLAKRLDDTNSKNPEIRAILARINPTNSESLGVSPTNSEMREADKTRLDKISKKEKSPGGSSNQPSANCPHLEIINLYNETLPELKSVIPSLWDNARKKNLQARWKQSPKHQSLDFWKAYFLELRNHSFYMGENDRGWSADLGWLVRAENFIKMIELFHSGTKR